METKLIHVRAIAQMAKSRTFITFLFMFLFTNTCFGATVEDLNTSIDNRWLGKESMRNILTELELTFDETSLIGYTEQFNLWSETIEDETISLKNIVFFKTGSNTTLYWVVGNGTFSNTLDYIYCLEAFQTNLNNSALRLYNFSNWNYNGDGSISSASTTSIKQYYCTNTTYGETSGMYIPYATGTVNVESIFCDQMITLLPTYIVYGKTKDFGYKTYFLTHTYDLELTEPIEPTPSGETSGDTGGETGGSTNYPDYSEELNNIQTSIGNVNNNLENIGNQIESGNKEVVGAVGEIKDFLEKEPNFENTTVSSGDIIGAIGYEAPENPYANFWLELTTILNNAFTGSNRNLTITGMSGKNYYISIDDMKWNPPPALKIFLTLASTTAIGIALIKWTTVIIEKISSGSIDEVLEANEEGICNLF